MVERDTLRRAAEFLYADRCARRRFRPLPADLRPHEPEDVYATQDALVELLAVDKPGGVGGQKIALSSKAMQDMVDYHQPCAGALLAADVARSPAEVSRTEFMRLGIECEVAVRLGADLSAEGAPYTRSSVAEAIATISVAFELIEDRDADYADIDPNSLIADNCWNAGVVLGEEIADWRALDLVGAHGSLAVNGTTVAEGRLGDAMGHPHEAVAWLANLMVRRGRMLARGEIVMTGSIVTTRFLDAGDAAVFAAEGLGAVSLSVT